MALEWIFFNLLIVCLLALDLFIFRKKKAVSFKEALFWSGVWVLLSLLFSIYIYFLKGKIAFLNFLTGYVIEKSLSVDNLFVFILIFSAFKTPKESMHKVLFWGILGAMVARAIFIFAGIVLVSAFHWMIYVLGVIILVSGIKMGLSKNKEIHPEKNLILKGFRALFPVTEDYEGSHFFVKRKGKLYATPLVLVLLMIESTDIVFAADSIPAIMAITLDPFIIYTSNIFAILGLRALFFVLASVIETFRYLHYGICLILILIGIKMLLSGLITIHPLITLSVVVVILLASTLLSLSKRKA